MNAIMKEEHSSTGTEHNVKRTMTREKQRLLGIVACADESTLRYIKAIVEQVRLA